VSHYKGNFTQTLLTHFVQEIKNLAKPEFQKNPEKFYPTDVFTNLGYSRN